MDHLGIDSAHVVGASMGGMIAQTMAIEHPERVRSLVSIMSTTGSRWTGHAEPQGDGGPARPPAQGPRGRDRARGQDLQRDRLARLPASTRSACATSPAAPTTAATAPPASLRQLHAITASGDRTQALRGVQRPDHRDPRQPRPARPPAGGRATARAIPGARLKMIDGMGHDLPRQLWPDFVEEIAANAARARAAVKQPA